MIFISKTDDYDEITNLIKNEKEFVSSNIDIQEKMKAVILNYMQNFATSTFSIDVGSVNSVYSFLDNLKESMQLCNENISKLENIINSLDTIIISLKNNDNNLNAILNTFNSEYYESNKFILQNTVKIQDYLYLVSKESEYKFEFSKEQEDNFEFPFSVQFDTEPPSDTEIQDVSVQSDTETLPDTEIQNVSVQSDAEAFPDTEIQDVSIQSDTEALHDTEIQNVSIQSDTEALHDTEIQNVSVQSDAEALHDTEIQNGTNPSSVSKDDIEKTKYEEDTLIVSESSGKVILPYQMSKVKKIYENNTDAYSSIDDVIKKKYTVPLSNYKITTISRFKEAFKLMRNKERSSITEALELAFELMFNYNLHPAIISACNNLDELDVYLDYLETGEVNKFKCFKVLFDLPPTTVKNKI